MRKKKVEYMGPVDQYGRPIDVTNAPNHAEDDRKLGIIFFTILGIATIIIVVILFLVNYFDQNRLEIPKATLSTTDWTKDSVIVTVDKSRGNVSEFSFDGGLSWQESNQLEVTKNKELTILARNKKGKVSKKATVVVSNIDQYLPEIYFINPLYITVDGKFDPKLNVSVLDSGSGIEDYEVDASNLNLTVPGEYQISYYLSDKIGNEIRKTRKVIVEDGVRVYQYRSRKFQVVDTTCDMPCECVPTVENTCPKNKTLMENNQCCNLCTGPCQKIEYGDWSEWSDEKILPSSDLEVEMKSEIVVAIQ